MWRPRKGSDHDVVRTRANRCTARCAKRPVKVGRLTCARRRYLHCEQRHAVLQWKHRRRRSGQPADLHPVLFAQQAVHASALA